MLPSRATIGQLAARSAGAHTSPIDRALDGAIMTAPAQRDPVLVARLGAVAGRALRERGVSRQAVAMQRVTKVALRSLSCTIARLMAN
jgi:hypothetical protein